MIKVLTIQPDRFVDQIIDGQEFYKLPYPYSVDKRGQIRFQDFWQGMVETAIGFVDDPEDTFISLYWREAVGNPDAMVGKYLVTSDSEDNWSTHHVSPIASYVVQEVSD